MKEWRRISLRAELINEIRDPMKRTNRYRSVAEFVSEAISHRPQKDHTERNENSISYQTLAKGLFSGAFVCRFGRS